MKFIIWFFIFLFTIQNAVFANYNDVFIADIQYDWIKKSEVEKEAIISEVHDIIFENDLSKQKGMKKDFKSMLKDKKRIEHYMAASAGREEYENFNIFEKLYIGIARVCKILIMQHNALFVVLCIITMIAVFMYSKSTMHRIISIIPVAFCFVYDTILRSHVIGDIMSVEFRQIYTYIPLVVSVAVLVCLCGSFVIIYKEDKAWQQYILLILMLCGGLATSVAMGFSPTIYVSGYRTATFMYFSFMYIILYLSERVFIKLEWDECIKKQWFSIAYCLWGILFFATLSLLR